MICACHISPIHRALITSMHTTRTTFFCDSEAGSCCKRVRAEAIAVGLLERLAIPKVCRRGRTSTLVKVVRRGMKWQFEGQGWPKVQVFKFNEIKGLWPL